MVRMTDCTNQHTPSIYTNTVTTMTIDDTHHTCIDTNRITDTTRYNHTIDTTTTTTTYDMTTPHPRHRYTYHTDTDGHVYSHTIQHNSSDVRITGCIQIIIRCVL